jgi:hypothetical protein
MVAAGRPVLSGSLADAALAPSGSMIGPMLAAVWLATSAQRGQRIAFLIATVAFAITTTVALIGSTGPHEVLLRDGGGLVRTMAIGTLFLLVGTMQFARAGERDVMRTS